MRFSVSCKSVIWPISIPRYMMGAPDAEMLLSSGKVIDTAIPRPAVFKSRYRRNCAFCSTGLPSSGESTAIEPPISALKLSRRTSTPSKPILAPIPLTFQKRLSVLMMCWYSSLIEAWIITDCASSSN
ncbi:Uncharacterised protein [Vibrio cholerae]|nr:Uncharacterised protein [Vibrio cholerae]